MQRARLVPPAAALCAGIVCDVVGIDGLALGGCIVAAIVMCVRRVPHGTPMLVAFVLGLADAACFAHPPMPPDDPHTRRYHATIVERVPARTNVDTSVLVRLDDGRVATADVRRTEGARECAHDAAGNLRVGERVELRGRVLALDLARNPGEPAERDLARERGIDARLAHAELLSCAGMDPFDVRLWPARARDAASRRIHADLGEPEASIVAGALWGERGALPRDVRDEFQETGTVHVLVTAGLHVGVVAWIATLAFRALGVGRISGALGTIALVWTYAEFSGGHLPSTRAAVMATFVLLARASGREAYLPNALAAAAIVIAATRPLSVVSLSFALSFSCVGAIVLFAGPIVRRLEAHGVPAVAAEAIALSAATQLGTWPLTASAFFVLAPYAMLANALVVPAVGVAMIVAAGELIASPIPALSNVLRNIDRVLVDWMIGVVRIVAHLPGSTLTIVPPPTWAIVVYDVALLVFAWAASRGRAALGAIGVVVAALLCVWSPAAPAGTLQITAIDVGQADALFVRTPRGHAFLIDAGGRLERGAASALESDAEAVGERIVVPFLLRRGVRRLDAVLLSHPHGDHAGGLAPVLRSIGVGGFADSGQSYPGHAYHDALDVAARRHVPMLEPRAGSIWTTDDGVTFRFYGPLQPYLRGTRSDINTNSLVFRLEYGRFRMLFTGDAGAETERAILAHGDDVRADVLKVGHHGSAYGTTPEFVRAIAPRDAIISVGRHNLFGHPAPETLATLRAFGVRVFRTDLDGAVTVESNGVTFHVAPFLQNASGLRSTSLADRQPSR